MWTAVAHAVRSCSSKQDFSADALSLAANGIPRLAIRYPGLQSCSWTSPAANLVPEFLQQIKRKSSTKGGVDARHHVGAGSVKEIATRTLTAKPALSASSEYRRIRQCRAVRPQAMSKAAQTMTTATRKKQARHAVQRKPRHARTTHARNVVF